MASYKLTRRDLVSGILKGAFSIPFALSPMGRLAYGQPAPSGEAPLRLITITMPFSPRTETTDGSNTDNNFIQIMWNKLSPEVREYTRFFSNFSYNISDNAWHGSAGFSHLLTCNSLAPYRGQNPANYPRTVSMDYEIARLIGSNANYGPYSNILNSPTMPMTLFSHSPYGENNEYTGSSEFYYPPVRGDATLDGDANFTCFLTYRPDGTVKNPLYPDTANAYSSIFGVQNNNTGEPIPETGLDQVLSLIHDTDIQDFINQKQINDLEQSNAKIVDLQRRVAKHQAFLSGQQSPPSGDSCSTPSVNWPGVGADFNALNDYNFEAIRSLITCDLHRVINFSFTDSEAAGMTDINANALNNTNINGHDSINLHLATHREITSHDGNTDENNEYIKSIYDYYYGQIGSLLQTLQEMPDPLVSGTNVLDNTIVYITGTTGFPDVHSANNMAIAMVGGGRRLDSGTNLLPRFADNGNGDYSAHVFDGSGAYPSESSFSYAGNDKVANLQLSILRLFGSNLTSWGTSGGRNNSDASSNGDSHLVNFARPGTSSQYRGS